jgi:hypothetical protein
LAGGWLRAVGAGRGGAEHGGRLSDLGLARVLDSNGSVTSFASTASVEFMDPDLLQGENPSRATDI